MRYSMFAVECKPMRVLDVIHPLSGKEKVEYIDLAESVFVEWKRFREQAGLPIINGRFGICRCRSDGGGNLLCALSFTAHVEQEHPLFDKPDLIAEAIDDLLERFMRNFVIRPFDPAIVYYGDMAWMRRKFAPDKKSA